MNQKVKIVFVFVGIVLSGVIVGLGLETTPRNHLGWVLVVVGLAYCLGGSIYLVAAKVQGAPEGKKGDRSLWLIGPGFLVVFAAPPLELLYLPPLLPHTDAMQGIGLGLVSLGLLLCLWAYWVLGPIYGGRLGIRAGCRLVQEGPYRFLRHPGYTGLGLLALGVCAGYSSLIGLVAMVALLAPGAVYRMRVEETLLEQQFGDKYRSYAQKTKRVIPGLW